VYQCRLPYPIFSPLQPSIQTDKKKGRGRGCLPRPDFDFRLEHEFAAELPNSGVLRASHKAKVLFVYIRVKGIELGVVEGVEGIGAELEVSPLAEGKRFVQCGGEVGAAWADNRILARIAETVVRTA